MRSSKEDKVEWLSETDVAKRLETLRSDNAAWRLPRDQRAWSQAAHLSLVRGTKVIRIFK